MSAPGTTARIGSIFGFTVSNLPETGAQRGWLPSAGRVRTTADGTRSSGAAGSGLPRLAFPKASGPRRTETGVRVYFFQSMPTSRLRKPHSDPGIHDPVGCVIPEAERDCSRQAWSHTGHGASAGTSHGNERGLLARATVRLGSLARAPLFRCSQDCQVDAATARELRQPPKDSSQIVYHA